MRIEIVGSAVDSACDAHFASSYLIGSDIAVDAGSIGLISSVARQRDIKHVFLSHSHADHLASLPMFLDNVYEPGPDCPTIYGSPSVMDALQAHVFNDRVWPDLFRLSQEETPFLRFHPLSGGQTVTVGEVRVTPIALDHVVPTFGFVIEDPASAIGIVSDTSPTEEVWRVLRGRPHLKAVFLEAAFPERMASLAGKAAHLTPSLFRDEIKKLGRDVPVIAVHIKPAFHAETVLELKALGLDGLQIAQSNQIFDLD